MHLLLVSTPSPWRFFTWMVALLTLIAVLIPFTTDAELDTKVATAAIGLAIGSLAPRWPGEQEHRPPELLGRADVGGDDGRQPRRAGSRCSG